MNWNDYEAVWKRQEPPLGPAADTSVGPPLIPEHIPASV